MTTTQHVAKILLDIKAVQIRIDPPFIWNTGLATPIYTDNKLIPSFPDARKVVVDAMVQVIKENSLKFDVLAGTATAGIPFAAFLAEKLDKPMVFVRAHPKEYGLVKQVEGTMPKGSRVLVIEDLISTGRSSLTTVTACRREYAASIVGVLGVFSYEIEKSKTAFGEANVSLYTLSDFSSLLEVATTLQYLTPEDKTTTLDWSKDPEAWSKAHGGA